MKYLIFIILVILVNYSLQRTFNELKQMWQANVLKFHDKCTEETGADPELTLRLMPYGEYVDDYKVKCYMRCILDNWSIFYVDHSVHHKRYDEIMYVDEPLLRTFNLPENCYNSIKLSDHCEKAYRLSECTYRIAEKIMTENESKA